MHFPQGWDDNSENCHANIHFFSQDWLRGPIESREIKAKRSIKAFIHFPVCIEPANIS
jgi:hypothetical protein